MNEIDFTFRPGSPVYVPQIDSIVEADGYRQCRIWRLGCVVSAYGVKSHPDEDFIYLVSIGSGGSRWYNLESIKDARTHSQPRIEYLDNE